MDLMNTSILKSIEERLAVIEEQTKRSELIEAELVVGEGLNNEALSEMIAAKVLAGLKAPNPTPEPNPLRGLITALDKASGTLKEALSGVEMSTELAAEIAHWWNNSAYQIVERVKRQVETQPQ